MSTELCDDEAMRDLVAAMQVDDDQIARIDALLARYPGDARLHFLRGSILIGKSRLIEAHRNLSRAVELAPDFHIARFQLGFFQLTSGEADAALDTWGRLDRLPDGHYLRKFVDGLRALIRDEFQAAVTSLREGIALNSENPPLNRDMQLLIDKVTPLMHGAAANEEDGAAVSATSLILGQFNKRDLH
jgi:hypothetical protein